jgi:hypothetical protein
MPQPTGSRDINCDIQVLIAVSRFFLVVYSFSTMKSSNLWEMREEKVKSSLNIRTSTSIVVML